MTDKSHSPAVEAAVQQLMKQINDYVGHRVEMETMPGHAELEAVERATDAVASAETSLESAIRAALTSQQEVAAPVSAAEAVAVAMVKMPRSRLVNLIASNELLEFADHIRAASRAPVAVGVESNDKTESLLSMAIGIIQGARNRGYPYTDNSPIAKFVAEAAEHLKNWPATQPAGAGGSVGASREQDSFHVANAESSRVQGAEPVGREHSYAIQEAHRIADCESYFKARPQIDTLDRRRVFEAGFDRGYSATPAPSVPAGGEAATKFKVRDRLIQRSSGRVATVIALTTRGFRYFLDERWELGPRHGFIDEGESFDDSQWEPILAQDAAPAVAVEAVEWTAKSFREHGGPNWWITIESPTNGQINVKCTKENAVRMALEIAAAPSVVQPTPGQADQVNSVYLGGCASGNVQAPGLFKNGNTGYLSTDIALALVCENCGQTYGAHFGPKCPESILSTASPAGEGKL